MSVPYSENGLEHVDQGPEDKALPLRNVVSALRKRWWVVVAVFLLVVGFTMWRTSRQERLYRATATIRLREPESAISGISRPTYLDYRIDPIQSEQQVIKSEAVGERVAHDLGLRLRIVEPAKLQRSALFGRGNPVLDSSVSYAVYELHLTDNGYSLHEGGRQLGAARYGHALSVPGISLTLPKRLSVEASKVTLQVIPIRSAAGIVRGGITTKGIPQTDIVEISYTGTDPVTVQMIANSVAETYGEFASESKQILARNRTAFIQQSLADQSVRLKETQDELKRFKESEKLSSVSVEQAALIEGIHQFESNLEAARAEQRMYRTLIGSLSPADTNTEQLRRLAGTDAIAKNAYISTLYTRWFDLVRRREEFVSQKRTADYRDVKAIDTLIVRTKEDLRASSDLYLKGLASRIESLESTIAGLRGRMDRYPGLEARELRLMGDLRTAQTTYDQLQGEYQRARIAESAEGGSVRVIDEASQPFSPIAPNRKRIFLTAVVFGLILGVGLAVVIDNLDDSVKSPDEVRDQLGLAVLGTIPRIKQVTLTPASDRGSDSGRLVTHFDPRSPVAEAYRSVRTSLAFARPHQDLRTIVLTSPGPADGKSTTVANLAITFAQQGQRTLLIDADLRRAVLDKLFEIPRIPGLTDVLVGQRSLQDVVHQTRIANLFVIGSGQFPPNPAELLGSPAMREALRESRESFDIVLMDSPPLLAVTDAAVLSTMADGAILIVRVGATAKTAVRRALAQLRTVHGRLVGTVLNDVDFSQGAFGGSYGYYYYYYYGQDGAHGRANGGRGLLGRIRNWTGAATSRRGSRR